MHAGYTMNYSATFDIKLHIYNNMLLQQNQCIRIADLAIDCTPCIALPALPLLDQRILNYYYKHVQTTTAC